MNYLQTESSAYVDDVVTALQDVFGYSKQMKHLYQHSVDLEYSWDEWEQMIHKELDNGRPVLYGAETETRQDPFHGIAHSFICDGYDNYGRYHFNWGWDGLHNGFYVLSVLDPKNNTVWGGYNRAHDMVINIMPNQESENQFLLQVYESAQGDGFELNRLDGTWEDIVIFGIENKGNVPFKGYIGYAITDAQGNIKKDIKQISECSLDVTYSNKFRASFIVKMEENENVMVAYSTDKEHWTVIRGASSDIADRCNIKGPASDQTVYYDSELDCRGNGLTLECPEKLEYNKDVTVKLIAKPGFTLPKANDISLQVAYGTIIINSTWPQTSYATYNEQTGELYISRIYGHLYIAAEGISTGEDIWWKGDVSLTSLGYVLNGSSRSISLNSEWKSYTVLLPSEITDKPLITLDAEASQSGAAVKITNPVWMDDMAVGTVEVTSVSGEVNQTYTVLFKLSGSTGEPDKPDVPDVPDDQTLTISSSKTLTGVKVETINIDSPTKVIAPAFKGVETQQMNITKGTDVRIVLYNENSLGTITNNGDLQLLNNYGDGLTSYTSFVNNGTLIDITGFITKVEGKAALEVYPLKATKKGNAVLLEGQALPGEGGEVIVEWEKAGENENWWSPIQKNTYRSGLRSSLISEEVTVTESGLYRMSVINNVDGISNWLVSLIRVSDSDIETDNAKITEDKTTVYGKDGVLYIHVARPSTAYIYSFDGRFAKLLPLTAGDMEVNLSQGQYVIRIDERVFKVVL
ncbi:hypothetical protein DW083_05450 [Parabacteroides sp. AF48-14]|uniref:C10 family peptidase n=1 Tax=Parabacteroides sp. AF48-14 TaxID=2292052 RepID=UPI000EFFEF26|nr:C10 family peptidase [Parabacteroides sp. AF48-14]RHO73609.1 hypothetical protein DW083_05450 [Parabacteroides sp. AF48-14]